MKRILLIPLLILLGYTQCEAGPAVFAGTIPKNATVWEVALGAVNAALSNGVPAKHIRVEDSVIMQRTGNPCKVHINRHVWTEIRYRDEWIPYGYIAGRFQPLPAVTKNATAQLHHTPEWFGEMCRCWEAHGFMRLCPSEAVSAMVAARIEDGRPEGDIKVVRWKEGRRKHVWAEVWENDDWYPLVSTGFEGHYIVDDQKAPWTPYQEYTYAGYLDYVKNWPHMVGRNKIKR